MSELDLLKKGDLVKSRWFITHKIGSGGFGQIYQAYDKLRRELVAVKVESKSQTRQSIRMEVTVLRRIQNRKHVCELLSGGTSTLYNYMIITLLGMSLSELRRNLSEQCFTLSTSLRISIQIIDAIESIHSIGFLHRDIKPSNFVIGRKNLRQLCIIDFGLARKYTDYDQQIRSARSEAGFRGTIRYASINAHNNRELGRHDDLWSFFYMLIEFLTGSLPWSKVKDKQSVGHIKETYDYNRFLSHLPNEFEQFLEHIKQLKYEDKPDYDFLRSLIILSIQRLGYHDDDPFDWEQLCQQNQINPSINIEEEKMTSSENKQNIISENNIHVEQNQSPLAQPHPMEHVNHDKHVNPSSEFCRYNSRLIKSSDRTNYHDEKETDSNRYHQLECSQFILNKSHESDCLKLYSIFTQKQPKLNQRILSFQRESRFHNKSIQNDSYFKRKEQGPPAANLLLTYISQQFSNALASGTPSLFSQWSQHHGETCTDDNKLKETTKSISSKADEQLLPSPRSRTHTTPLKNQSLEQKRIFSFG